MNILNEFKGEGLINKVAVKYSGWLFLMITSVAVIYVYNHETLLETYILSHSSQHIDLHDHIDSKLDDIMDQIDSNYIAVEISRKIDKEEYKLLSAIDKLAAVKRIIERSSDELPAIYFEDRDRYVLEITLIEMEILSLKAQM